MPPDGAEGPTTGRCSEPPWPGRPAVLQPARCRWRGRPHADPGVLVDALDHGAFVVVGSLDAPVLGDEAEGRAFLQRPRPVLMEAAFQRRRRRARSSSSAAAQQLGEDDVPAAHARDETMMMRCPWRRSRPGSTKRLQAVGVVHGFLATAGPEAGARAGAGRRPKPAEADFPGQAAWATNSIFNNAASSEPRTRRRARIRTYLDPGTCCSGSPGLGNGASGTGPRGGQVTTGTATRYSSRRRQTRATTSVRA